MSKTTYLQRLRHVLSDLAKAMHTSNIDFATVVERIHDDIERAGAKIGPRSREFIRAAVTREVRARRLIQTRYPTSHTLQFTPSGLNFFKSWGVTALHRRQDAVLGRLPIKEIQRQTAFLRGVLAHVQAVLGEYRPTDPRLDQPEEFVNIIQHIIREGEVGNDQYTQLSQIMSAERARERELKRGIVAAKATLR